MATSDIKKGPLYVDSTNNRVGVGTSSPQEQLQLTNSAGRVSIFMSSGSTNQGYISYFDATQTLSLGNASPTGTGVNGGQQLNISNSGYVTIPQMARSGFGLNLIGVLVTVVATYVLVIPFFDIVVNELPTWVQSVPK